MSVAAKSVEAPRVSDAGEVEAVIATLNVVDHDGDVIAPGAIPSGTEVLISEHGHSAIMAWLHNTGAPTAPPVGKGHVVVEGNRAILRGAYFMETIRGREAFLTVKAAGTLQQWSHSFFIREKAPPTPEWKAKGARAILAKIIPFEVSPVTIAGGLGTGTISAREQERAQQLGAEAVAMTRATLLRIGPRVISPRWRDETDDTYIRRIFPALAR